VHPAVRRGRALPLSINPPLAPISARRTAHDSDWTRETLGWKPTHAELQADMAKACF
jgi:hypothetical protein